MQDRTLQELEEAQKLELRLSGRGLSSREAPGQAPTGLRGENKAKFPEFFAPLCRALPELPKLRELVLYLYDNGIGQGPGGPFRSARGGERILLLPLAGADGAQALAAGLGQQKELERLTLHLQYNSLGLRPQLRSTFRFLISSLLAAAPHLGLGLQADCIHASISVLISFFRDSRGDVEAFMLIL